VPPVEKQITIIILTTISGICAQVERNKRQNETQLNFRDVPKDPKEPGRALEGHRFEYSAAPLDCGGVATGSGSGSRNGIRNVLGHVNGRSVALVALCGWATCNHLMRRYTWKLLVVSNYKHLHFIFLFTSNFGQIKIYV